MGAGRGTSRLFGSNWNTTTFPLGSPHTSKYLPKLGHTPDSPCCFCFEAQELKTSLLIVFILLENNLDIHKLN